MKTKIVLFSFVSLCVVIWGCSSSNFRKTVSNECLKYEGTDSELFLAYHFLTFSRKNGDKLYLISVKTNKSFNPLIYDSLVYQANYCFDLQHIDTIITAPLAFYNGQDNIIIDGVLIWSKGKFVVDLYNSRAIIGNYIYKNPQ